MASGIKKSSILKPHLQGPGEMAQAPELDHISTDRDKICCDKTPVIDVDSYQISSGLVDKSLSYEAFNFYYKIVNLLHFIVKKK